MTNDAIIEQLRVLAVKLREDTSKLAAVAAGKLTMNEVGRVAEKAHLTALHVAQCMEAFAGFIDENAPAGPSPAEEAFNRFRGEPDRYNSLCDDPKRTKK